MSSATLLLTGISVIGLFAIAISSYYRTRNGSLLVASLAGIAAYCFALNRLFGFPFPQTRVIAMGTEKSSEWAIILALYLCMAGE